jgi:hypothetical protein
LKGEIKKKNQFSKRTKKIKRIRIEIDIKIKTMFWLKDKIEKNNKFYKKKNQEKIRNQNNEDQIGKHNIINLNWMMKLKTNKTFTKWSRKK